MFLDALNITKTLDTNCLKCSVKWKQQVKKLINILETKKPEQWKSIQEKYDPTGEKTKIFKETHN